MKQVDSSVGSEGRDDARTMVHAPTRRTQTLRGRQSECETLDRLLADAASGASRVVVLRGDAGVGKSALLRYVVERAVGWRVLTVAGVEAEMELAYSGLHQLCVPMLDHLDRLPPPQQDALATVFGLSAGTTPDRFLVALATLTLLAEETERRPLLGLIDDAQWLDQATAQILGFVSRRLLAERVALVAATRTGADDQVLGGLPELPVNGLNDGDARSLLSENLPGPVDGPVFEQIISECHGNPLALLELPRGRSAAELAGGFALLDGLPMPGRIEQSYADRLRLLSPETQLLVLTAAAEPAGDPLLLYRTTQLLGIDMAAADPAIDAGLLGRHGRIEFSHPLARSAAYRAATLSDRQRVHRALADAIDAETDPDRRAWHRAHAALVPDEGVAIALEGSANRARERGGYAASAAFLARASELSPEPARRAERALAAAGDKFLAGLHDDSSALVATAMRGPLSPLDTATGIRLRGQIAIGVDVREATALLLDAAQRLESLDTALSRETYLEALLTASTEDRSGAGPVAVAQAARAAPPATEPPGVADLLLDGLAVLFTDGVADGAPILRRALALSRGRVADERGWIAMRLPARIAAELLDDETWEFLASRQAQIAREHGLFEALPYLLGYLGTLRIVEGNLDAAEAVLVEADAIGHQSFLTRLLLAGYRADEEELARLRHAIEPSFEGDGVIVAVCEHAASVIHNALARYKQARAAAEASFADELNLVSWALPELIEAAVRSGDMPVAVAAYERLVTRARACGTDLAYGFEARARALVSDGPAAEAAFREAVELLGRTRLRLHLARTHLLYGEWLRREGRRIDAREQLSMAHEMLSDFGAHGFAERARRELLATGATARARRDDTRGDLTPQELEISRLAAEGQTNPEIGAHLFLSPRTVEWHLRKVFSKLEVSSRKDLRRALSDRTLTRAS